MPMDNGNSEAAILVFAKPSKPRNGVTPPMMAKSKMSEMPKYENDDEKCEYCEGEGCEHCEKDEGYEASAEDTHKSHMAVIAKLAKMLEEKR